MVYNKVRCAFKFAFIRKHLIKGLTFRNAAHLFLFIDESSKENQDIY